jgi:hypothetical protein
MRLVEEAATRARGAINSFLETAAETSQEGNGKKTFTLTGDQVHKFRKLRKALSSSQHAFRLIPRSFVVSLVSQYDSYIGNLIRLVLLAKPEILNASERTLSFSDLVRFGSLDAARDFLIEKEVESVIRQSHAEQFCWFENKLKIPLRKDLEAWPAFIEVTERRNLFVHCDGVVSSQYLAVCRQHDVALSESCVVGKRLRVSSRYFAGAFQCVYEVGVKLAQVLWRKLIPEELEDADTNLNQVCYEVLVAGNNKLAIKLLDFATMTLKKHSSESCKADFCDKPGASIQVVG